MQSFTALMIIAFAGGVFAVINAISVRQGLRARRATPPTLPLELKLTADEQRATRDAFRAGTPIEDSDLARKILGQWDAQGRQIPLRTRDPFRGSRLGFYALLGVAIVVGLAGHLPVIAAFLGVFLVLMVGVDGHRVRTIRRIERWVEAIETSHPNARDTNHAGTA